MTIPGVGIRTAETFVAWVDDIDRFRNNRQLGSTSGWCRARMRQRIATGLVTSPAMVRR
jgi:transposase